MAGVLSDIRLFLKPFVLCAMLAAGATAALLPAVVSAQTMDPVSPTTTTDMLSPKKALFYSFVLPGLGQRYANEGQWGGWGTAHALLDLGLWASLFGVNWQEGQAEENYRTLAASRAGAIVDGKDRTFFLNLASYRSSDEFLDTVLRNRAWDQINYVDDPAYQWQWVSDEDYASYRSERESAESASRKRNVIIASLVANRLISGITAALSTGKTNKRNFSLQLGPPTGRSSIPVAHARLTF
jgi:hypothetical protein